MTEEADQEDVEQAMEWIDCSDLKPSEMGSPHDHLEHILIENDEHPDQIALHDPSDTSDAWITAHGDSFIDLREVR